MSASTIKNFVQLIKKAQLFAPLKTAIVHPVTEEALLGAVAAHKAKLISAIFVGPSHKIKKVAQKIGINLSTYSVVATEHSHAAASQAVALARAGEVQMIMKGSLHTDEFMQAIVNKEQGLRTAYRMSHVFLAQIPAYRKLLLLTDCALNVKPTLNEKKDIIQNAIHLALALGINMPKVAILSAVETVTDKLPSTLDAAALCKMAERGQIMQGIVDGPLAFDNAISAKAAAIKHLISPVVGNADILVAPDLEAGNMLAKQLHYFGHAQLAGVIIGARLPIILTSRADTIKDRLASCALAKIYAQYLINTVNLKKI